MDIQKLVLKELVKKKKIKVVDIVRATGFSRAYINRFFKELRNKRKIVLIGKANKAHYISAEKDIAVAAKKKILSLRRILKNVNLSESIVLDETKRDTGIFLDLPKNVAAILDYAFTEMLNNAIEHSHSDKIIVVMERDVKGINFQVIDFGIGIFKNIIKKRKLKNELEAIQDLLKGKQTTLPKEHTGEGIFFTSKAGDKLIIRGSGKKLIFDNILKDVFIEDIKAIKGTKIKFEISKNSKQNLSSLFREYSGKAFEFSKTKVTVNLYEIDNAYISRSQARRILNGLDKFKIIILDFKKVKAAGQGFADEVFRVWQNHHPNIEIIYKNTNQNISFMIKRALSVKRGD